jgi:dTDP-4-amino-4,6-dideoxygalactose transaminase
MQAAVLSVNLKYLDAWNARRSEIAKIYTEKLQKLGIKILITESDSIFHHFIVESENRDATRNLLDAMGVKTEIHYPECAEISYGKFKKDYPAREIDNASRLSSKTISLPISPWMSNGSLEFVINSLGSREVLESFHK